jgi:hypothetical protein
MRGRPLPPRFAVARHDSSPVISKAPHRPDFEPLLDRATEHHHRAKATARVGLLDYLRELFEIVDKRA